jgi:hypothetical protein
MLTGMAAAAPAPPGDFQAARPAYWLPLLLFGGLAALSLPLSVLGSPRLSTGYAVLSVEVYPTITQAMYFGGGSATGPFPFPLGWYWVGALVAGLLLTGAWYRWWDRRTGRQTPLRGYLVTGLVLTAVTAVLPLTAWGTQVQVEGPGLNTWSWLEVFWRLGTFALLAMGVSLAILARSGHSRALGIITAVYVAAVCFAGFLELRQAFVLPGYPFAGSAVLLPAAVLLLSGLGALASGLLGRRR